MSEPKVTAQDMADAMQFFRKRLPPLVAGSPTILVDCELVEALAAELNRSRLAERAECADTLIAMCGEGQYCRERCMRCRALRRGAEEILARGES